MATTSHESFIVLFKGRRYDVGRFIDTHPGGKEMILPYEGLDIDDAMHDADHSIKAFSILEDYLEIEPGKIASDEKQSLVDFSKAVLPQVMKMSPEVYHTWVLSKPHIHGSKVRIFELDFFEMFSRYPWQVIFLWLPALVCVSLYYFWAYSFFISAGLIVCGALSWTLFEYIMHRFLFHMTPHNRVTVFIHFFIHGIHHLIPQDPERIVFPIPFSAPIGLAVFGINRLVFQLLGFPGWELMFSAGFGLAYILYDYLHYIFHFGVCSSQVLSYLKTYHLEHHFTEEENNFGVTSPFWDIVFGTYRKKNNPAAIDTAPIMEDNQGEGDEE